MRSHHPPYRRRGAYRGCRGGVARVIRPTVRHESSASGIAVCADVRREWWHCGRKRRPAGGM